MASIGLVSLGDERDGNGCRGAAKGVSMYRLGNLDTNLEYKETSREQGHLSPATGLAYRKPWTHMYIPLIASALLGQGITVISPVWNQTRPC